MVPILEEIKDKPKYLHNSLFDIPRLYRRFGVLLDQNVYDTMLASRVARAGEREKKNFKVIQKAHSLDGCLERALGVEIPKDRKLKWGGPLQEEHLEYAVDDVAHLKDLHEALQEILREHGVEERYKAISSRLPDFIGADVRGVPLDISTLQPALDALEREKADLESRLNELAPEHPEGLKWVWGNTSKDTSPKGKGRNGALRALGLLGVELFDLQDQTLCKESLQRSLRVYWGWPRSGCSYRQYPELWIQENGSKASSGVLSSGRVTGEGRTGNGDQPGYWKEPC